MEYHHKLDPVAYPTSVGYKKYLVEKLEHSEVYTHKKNGKLIGMSLYFIQNRRMHITDLVVDKKHRGNGYGSKILRAVEKIAKKRNCNGITLRVSVVNVIAHTLYAKNDYKEASVTMYKRLK